MTLFRRFLCNAQYHALFTGIYWKMLHPTYSANGQWPLEMNKSVSLPCYDTWKYFHHHGIDLTILITISLVTAILIVTANGCLLIKLLQKKDKVRADKLSAILCFSDNGIGAYTIPLQSVLLFSPNLEIVCSLHKLMVFASSFPFSFSLVMPVIIFTDRCFIITRCRLYKKCITMKVLYIIKAIELALSITSITLIALTRELKLHPTKFDFFHIFQCFQCFSY